MNISIYENHHFTRESIIDINAAVVGISRSRWIAIDEANEKEAKKIMKQNRFDILPIDSETKVKSYFRTIERNNYDKIEEAEINHRDVIPLQTNIRDVSKNFYTEERSFFFLLDENKISGLIAESNFNSRLVKVWLYSLLSELELKLSDLVTQNINEVSLKQKVFDINDNNSRNIKRRFESDSTQGVELNFVEYLYLSTLIDIIKKENLFSTLGYKNENLFNEDFNKINKLRNKVMHSNSIITSRNSAKELWLVIDKIEETLFLLR